MIVRPPCEWVMVGEDAPIPIRVGPPPLLPQCQLKAGSRQACGVWRLTGRSDNHFNNLSWFSLKQATAGALEWFRRGVRRVWEIQWGSHTNKADKQQRTHNTHITIATNILKRIQQYSNKHNYHIFSEALTGALGCFRGKQGLRDSVRLSLWLWGGSREGYGQSPY